MYRSNITFSELLKNSQRSAVQSAEDFYFKIFSLIGKTMLILSLSLSSLSKAMVNDLLELISYFCGTIFQSMDIFSTYLANSSHRTYHSNISYIIWSKLLVNVPIYMTISITHNSFKNAYHMDRLLPNQVFYSSNKLPVSDSIH